MIVMKKGIEKYLSEFEEKPPSTKKRYASSIADKAKEKPDEVSDYVPLIQPHIDVSRSEVDEEAIEDLLTAVGKVGEEYPEVVLPLVPQLKDCFDNGLETGEYMNAVAASYALGMVAKEYPNVAEENIPRLVEATRLDNKYVSNNSMALLADLAYEYGDKLLKYLPRYAEELEADDNYMRYNSLTVISHVAKEDPDSVEEVIGVEKIVKMLDAEDEPPRENACWTLHHLGERAASAVPELEKIAEKDESERVRKVAKKAIHRIEKRDKDWKI